MDSAERAEQILVDSGAILRGDHFVYVTGEHGDGWVAKDAVFPHTDRVDELCRMLAAEVSGRAYDYVCGPGRGRGHRLQRLRLADRGAGAVVAPAGLPAVPRRGAGEHAVRPTGPTSWPSRRPGDR